MAWSELLRTSYETCTSCPGWTGAVACIARKFHGRPSRKLESNCISTVRFESCWVPDTASELCSRLNPVSWHTFAYRGGSTYPNPNMAAATPIRMRKSLRWRVAVVIQKGLFDHRWNFERMLGRGRWQCPLQPYGTLPHAAAGRCATTHALHNHIKKQQLRKAEACGPDARYHVEVSELQWIVGNAPRHTGQP